ncbi:hypothetical protein L6164_015718 [Bauhinia variegata]|uniref:Uncharacterized protein n=1 Tax=Bauhinia variegata TaxID=167791 RepID=A0ACB9NM18_BAUVA|nr:hypothetical protein L6164_015718 [Bauhinia variegata]
MLTRKSVTPSEQREAEQRAFASILASRSEETVIGFNTQTGCRMVKGLLFNGGSDGEGVLEATQGVSLAIVKDSEI